MNSDTKKILERVASWPEEDQQELAEIAADIEAARKGEFVSADEIEALYRLHRKV